MEVYFLLHPHTSQLKKGKGAENIRMSQCSLLVGLLPEVEEKMHTPHMSHCSFSKDL